MDYSIIYIVQCAGDTRGYMVDDSQSGVKGCYNPMNLMWMTEDGGNGWQGWSQWLGTAHGGNCILLCTAHCTLPCTAHGGSCTLHSRVDGGSRTLAPHAAWPDAPSSCTAKYKLLIVDVVESYFINQLSNRPFVRRRKQVTTGWLQQDSYRKTVAAGQCHSLVLNC